VTDSVEEAKAHADATWAKTKVDEKAHKEEQDKNPRLALRPRERMNLCSLRTQCTSNEASNALI